MVSFRGNGWGGYLDSERDWFEHYMDTVDSITWILNEIRKMDYIEENLETFQLEKDALELLQDDP